MAENIFYSFVSLLIGPCCLDPICRIQRNIWLKTRQQGPINMETKELCISVPPFWNKVMGSNVKLDFKSTVHGQTDQKLVFFRARTQSSAPP